MANASSEQVRLCQNRVGALPQNCLSGCGSFCKKYHGNYLSEKSSGLLAANVLRVCDVRDLEIGFA